MNLKLAAILALVGSAIQTLMSLIWIFKPHELIRSLYHETPIGHGIVFVANALVLSFFVTIVIKQSK